MLINILQDPSAEMGQRLHLSDIDVYKVQQMYCPDDDQPDQTDQPDNSTDYDG